MGDRIAVMNAGRIVQVDDPLAVYDRPADTFVGGFIGTPPMNFLAAEIVADGALPVARLSGGDIPLGDVFRRLEGRSLTLGIRAESVRVEPEDGTGAIRASVVVVEPLGSHNLLTVRSGGDTLKVSAPPDVLPAPGSDVWLRIDPGHIRWMHPVSGQAFDPERDEPSPEPEEVLSRTP
jgi:multiple sugar transport system ATP-binding protein